MSVTYDSVELVAATYIPRYIQHETAPERKINSIKLARQDGEMIIDDNFGVKFIDVMGVLTGTSQANLEANIDSFKELISRKDKNLDISFANGTRRYVCRSISHEFNRDHFHLLHVPYKIRFLVAKGYGTDTSETTAINEAGITAAETTKNYTFAGSYYPKPRHRISLNTRGNLDVVRITNMITGDYIDLDWGNVSGQPSWIEVNEENLTVLNDSGAAVNYRGKFPSVALGAEQSIKLTIIGSGSTLDQQQTSNTGGNRAVIYDNGTYIPWQSQSFVPSQSGRIHKLTLYVDKVDGGTLDGPMQFIIYTDDNNKPGTVLGGGIGYEISHANVPTSVAWTDAIWQGTDAQRPFLTAGTRYWIVLNPGVITGSDINNFYGWWYNDVATGYTLGKAMTREGSNASWVDGASNAQTGNALGQFDVCFKIYLGVDGGAVSHNVLWQCYYTKKYL